MLALMRQGITLVKSAYLSVRRTLVYEAPFISTTTAANNVLGVTQHSLLSYYLLCLTPTSSTPIMQSMRILNVSIKFTAASGQDSSTASIEFVGNGPAMIKTGVAQGDARSAVVSYRPPKNSLSGDWFDVTSYSTDPIPNQTVVQISCPSRAIVSFDVEMYMNDSTAPDFTPTLDVSITYAPNSILGGFLDQTTAAAGSRVWPALGFNVNAQ